MVEGSMKREAVLGLPEVLEVGSFDVADQVITLTVISTQQVSLPRFRRVSPGWS
jgi:hypothetical protein